MLSLPLPFVVALLLLILLGQMLGRSKETGADRLFLLLLGAYAAQSTIIGLRWGYGLNWLLPLQSVLAALIAPLSWLCFSRLVRQDTAGSRPPAWVHGLPAAMVLALIALWPSGIDLVLIATFLGYGIALARLARMGPDALSGTSFEGAVSTSAALRAVAAVLILSAGLEVVVFLDFALSAGTHAALVVGIVNLFALLVLGSAAAVAGRSQPPPELNTSTEALPIPEPDGEDLTIVERLDWLIRQKRLFEDLDLNLDRLARKAVIPARRISTAINRVTGKNVSQYINDYRVAEACRLLGETEEPVTAIMFKSGFGTKSNFNREFRRVTGSSPTAWRADRRSKASKPVPA